MVNKNELPQDNKICYNPIKLPFEIESQSERFKGSETIKVSRLTSEAQEGKFMRFLYDDTRTLYEVFRRGVKESNNGPCLGWRDGKNKPYQWLHYNEALLRARNFGSGLISLGLQPGQGTCVGIYSQNVPEWILTEQGLYCQSMVIVPLYDTLGPEACNFIISQANISTVVVQDERKLLLILANPPRALRNLISINYISEETKAKAKKLGIDIRLFEEVEAIGAENEVKEIPPKPENLCTVCYTSSTTGKPKGVMLTHENVVASVSAAIHQLQDYKPQKTDVMLSFLPLAHMLERTVQMAVYIAGGSVGFYSGDVRHLTEDYKALRPTLSPTVPRLMNRIYEKFVAQMNMTCIGGILMNYALSRKTADLKRGIVSNNTIWDKLYFHKVQEWMGGRMRMLVVGSAPLSGTVLNFMRCALGCLVIEGYGQTECVAPATLTAQGDYHTEHVGAPLACNAIKLIDNAEMGYYSSRSQGEICIKGANVFSGYFRDSEKTKEALDQQGWLHTGDIGEWTSNGTLKIIDRKKHTFKLSQGEYIVPDKIESIYIKSTYVSQVFVHGDSLKSCIVGIIVPNVGEVKKWAKQNGISGTLTILCADNQVRSMVLEDLQETGRQAGLKSFEQVQDIYLHPDRFSVQNGLLSPNHKSRRMELKKYFRPQIDDLYASLDKLK